MEKLIKKTIIVFTMILIFISSTYAQNFAEESANAFSAKDYKKLEKLLPDWEKAEPKNPEVQIAWFNYYLERNLKIVPTQGLMPDGRMGLYDRPVFNDNDVKLAIECLDKVLKDNPDRLDVHFGKCHSLIQAEHYDEGGQAVVNMIETSKKIKQWKWSKGAVLDYDVEMAVFSGVNDYSTMLCNGFDASKNGMAKMVVSIEKNYPKNTIGLNCCARYYTLIKDYKKAVATLKKAYDLNTQDYVILGNLGYLYELSGNIAEAKKRYEKMAKMSDPKAQQYAKEYLDELDKK